MRKNITSVILGIVVAAVGVGIIGNAVGLWDFNVFFKGWWALLLMIVFLIAVINDGPHFFNVIGLVLFGLLFAQNYIPFLNGVNIWILICGLAVIILGLRLIIRAVKPERKIASSRQEGSSEYGETVDGDIGSCTFSSGKTNYAGRTFSGGKFSCAFGDYTVDLCGATITEGAVLKVENAFGSVKVILDRGTKVSLKKSACFGSVKYDGTESAAADIFIEADSAFGSVKIIQK